MKFLGLGRKEENMLFVDVRPVKTLTKQPPHVADAARRTRFYPVFE
jgi:hypothetical protein